MNMFKAMREITGRVPSIAAVSVALVAACSQVPSVSDDLGPPGAMIKLHGFSLVQYPLVVRGDGQCQETVRAFKDGDLSPFLRVDYVLESQRLTQVLTVNDNAPPDLKVRGKHHIVYDSKTDTAIADDKTPLPPDLAAQTADDYKWMGEACRRGNGNMPGMLPPDLAP